MFPSGVAFGVGLQPLSQQSIRHSSVTENKEGSKWLKPTDKSYHTDSRTSGRGTVCERKRPISARKQTTWRVKGEEVLKFGGPLEKMVSPWCSFEIRPQRIPSNTTTKPGMPSRRRLKSFTCAMRSLASGKRGGPNKQGTPCFFAASHKPQNKPQK